MPQSKWPCRRCRGQGCDVCNHTGKRYERTVEELMAGALRPLTGATRNKLHSTGREDVDVRMLGNGRPFVLELAEPKIRTVDLALVQEEINKKYGEDMEIRELQFVDRSVLKAVTAPGAEKSYCATVTCLSPASRTAVEQLVGLAGAVIRQETPRRVLHRRPNRVRRRQVHTCTVKIPSPSGPVKEFLLTLRVQSGTYIKELISGDEGRTYPSVGGLLGVPCDCTQLDVLDVHCDPLKKT